MQTIIFINNNNIIVVVTIYSNYSLYFNQIITIRIIIQNPNNLLGIFQKEYKKSTRIHFLEIIFIINYFSARQRALITKSSKQLHHITSSNKKKK